MAEAAEELATLGRLVMDKERWRQTKAAVFTLWRERCRVDEEIEDVLEKREPKGLNVRFVGGAR
jgi:hypothetical protein